jgi:hypothetical protein
MKLIIALLFGLAASVHAQPFQQNGVSGGSPSFTTLTTTGDGTIGGQLTVKGTATVQGNAFSVGGSTFVVSGGGVGVGVAATAVGLRVVTAAGTSGFQLDGGTASFKASGANDYVMGLHGGSSAANEAAFEYWNGSTKRWITGLNVNVGGNALEFTRGTSIAPALLITSSDRVGIGATSPGSKLHMSSGTLTVDGTNATVVFATMTSTYGSGSAHVCVTNAGLLFASEAACP